MVLYELKRRCPRESWFRNQDAASDASCWSVSGTGPMRSPENMNEVVETGRKLLLSIARGVSNVARDVTQRLIKLIENIARMIQNKDSNLNLSIIEKTMKLSTRTADDALILWTKTNNKNNPTSDVTDSLPVQSVPKPPSLLRQATFDRDISNNADSEARSSPPKIFSFPIIAPQLCTTLSQMSLKSSETNGTLVEILMKARRNLEHALKSLLSNPQDLEGSFYPTQKHYKCKKCRQVPQYKNLWPVPVMKSGNNAKHHGIAKSDLADSCADLEKSFQELHTCRATVVVRTMDNMETISGTTMRSAQKIFFQWAIKWFYTNYSEDVLVKPDAPELACLLQAMGFQLRECNHKEDDNSESKSKNDSVKVIIECGTSKMRVVMEMEDVSCQCPNQDDAKDPSFWSVSGTGPMGSMENMNKVVETGSNLLPPISKGVSNVARDVTQRLIKLIKNIPDMNQNTDSNLNLSTIEKTMKLLTRTADDALVRRHFQSDFSAMKCGSLDTLINNEMLWTKTNNKNNPTSDVTDSLPVQSVPKPPPLLRQATFDRDISSNADSEARSYPPKILSFPIISPQLCTTLSQMSLESSETNGTLVEILMKTRSNLEHALKSLLSNSQDLEDVFLKPAPPRNSSLKISPENISRPGSSCSLPYQSKLQTTGLQKPSVRRNAATSFRKSNDVRSPASSKLSATGKSLPQQRRTAPPKSHSRSALPQMKFDTARSTNSCASTLNSLSSRTIISAKRRVSPDPKSSPSVNSNQRFDVPLSKSHLKVTSHGETSHTNTEASKSNPSGGITSKFGFVRKKM